MRPAFSSTSQFSSLPRSWHCVSSRPCSGLPRPRSTGSQTRRLPGRPQPLNLTPPGRLLVIQSHRVTGANHCICSHLPKGLLSCYSISPSQQACVVKTAGGIMPSVRARSRKPGGEQSPTGANWQVHGRTGTCPQLLDRWGRCFQNQPGPDPAQTRLRCVRL